MTHNTKLQNLFSFDFSSSQLDFTCLWTKRLLSFSIKDIIVLILTQKIVLYKMVPLFFRYLKLVKPLF